jgi:alkylhydroperoxidase family enzyme
MPRLHQVSRAEASAPIVTTMYDLLFEDRDPVTEPGTATGTRGDWWPAFANVPDILEHAVQGFGLYQSPRRVLDPVLRELGQARAGWAAGSRFVFSQHCKSLRALGQPDDKIEAVGYWPAASCFTELERLVLAFTDCLVLDRGRVPDQLFAAIHQQLGDQATLELTYITSLYLQHAVMSRALRTEWDDVDERVVEIAGPDDTTSAGLNIALPQSDEHRR